MKSNSSVPGGPSPAQKDGLGDRLGETSAETYGHHIARTARLAVPVMLSRAGMVVMLSVDSAIVGHLINAKAQLAALGAALIPIQFLQAMAIGLLIGIVVFPARFDGARKPQACGQIWRMGLLMALTVGFTYAVALSFGDTLLDSLGQPAEVAKDGGKVLRAFGWGLPGMLVFIACAHFMEGINKPVPPMLLTLGANVVNAALAYGFGFGAFGLPEGGVVGVAIATSVVRTLLGLTAILMVLRSVDRERYGITLSHREGFRDLGRLVRFGLPLGAAIGLEAACFGGVVNMSGWIGPASIATMQVAINLTSLVYMLTIGLSTAAAVRVGNAIGRDDERNAQRAGWIAVALVGCVMTVCAVLMAAFADKIASVYTDDPEVLALLVPALAAVVSIMIVVDGLQGVLMGALRGHADTIVPTIIYAVSFWAIGMPAGYWWGYHEGNGPQALLWSLVAALTAATIALAWRFKYLPRRGLRY